MHRFSIKSFHEGSKSGSYMKLYPTDARYNYNEVVKEIGFGKYQYKMLAAIALMNTSIGVFSGLLSFLIPIYKQDVPIDKWEIGFLVASQGLGSMIGGLFFSYLSDLKGRKLSLLLALAFTIIGSVLCTLFDTFWPFLFFRFASAIGFGGLMPVAVTYLSEYLPDNSRGFYLVGMDIFKSLGGLITIIIASFSDDNWRYFVLSPVPIFILSIIIMSIYLPESSRYLMQIGNISAVVDNFNVMSKENKGRLMIEFCETHRRINEDENSKEKISIGNDLIVRKAGITIPLSMIWFFPAFGMGIFVFLPEIMLLQEMPKNHIYMLSAIGMIIPMCGVFAISFFIDNFGRKQLISMCSLIAGLSLGMFLVVPDSYNSIIMYYVIMSTFSLFMKILKSVTSAYTPELYSTRTRTTALGMMSGIDRFASILQPMIFTSLIYSTPKLAMASFGFGYLICFFGSMFLGRETANRPLKESFMLAITQSENGMHGLDVSLISGKEHE